MNLPQFLDFLKRDPDFSSSLAGVFTLPGRAAEFDDPPPGLRESLLRALEARGIRRLYSHQSAAVAAALRGENVVVVTPTASGKSLSYILPIFQRKIENPNSRALFLFPTKALSQDQLAGMNDFNENSRLGYRIHTFDGDTPSAVRRKIREAGDFVVTNPDMLHAGILPHHTEWIKLFENLEFIVIDELHAYRGVFGSHLANVLRRLLRVCRFYGSRPQFMAASATIANPREHAEKLTGLPFTLIDKSGAPQGDRHVVFYNPPVINAELGIRASAIKEAAKLGAYLIKNRISTIFFCRSRLRVELLFTYLRDRAPELADRIRSYRGGYLPNERRRIEGELRDGKVLGVVSTNALELGVDIGSLDVSVSLGYPGSISSLFQQFGRAGRGNEEALSLVIATSDGTDQYLIAHPERLLKKNPERALSNPDNILIVADHLKCAAFEIPFGYDESFGNYPAAADILEHLREHHVLTESDGKYHWMSDVYPAGTFSLRSGARENFVIVDITQTGREQVIGEMDYFSAPTMIHKDAIYLHQGEPYYVEDLLWEDRQARVKRIAVDYYTDAQEKVDISVLEQERLRDRGGVECYRGELSLRIKAVMYKKIKLETHENLGWGDIHTPEIEMHTQAAWLLLPVDFEFPVERHETRQGAGLAGTAYALGMTAPLFVLCDPRDIRFRSEVRSPAFGKPALYFYDATPGGLELSYGVMENLSLIADSARDLVERCPCGHGCPSCVGLPDFEVDVKKIAVHFLKSLGD